MPPAVALLNYISSGKLWRIFCQTGTFCGVFSISNNAVRISAAAMGGAEDIILIKKRIKQEKIWTYTGAYTVIFRGGFSIKFSVVQWKDICPRQPEFGPEKMHLFLEIKAQRSSDRVQRSSDRMQHSSVECSIA